MQSQSLVTSYQSRRIAIWFVALVIFATSVVAQININNLNTARSVKRTAGINTYNEPYVLPEIVLANGAAGFRNLTADYYWLSLIQYFGAGDPFGEYRQLPHLLNAITTLDPKFVYPYTFGLLILPDQGFVDEAIALGEKGLVEVPHSWEIPYYLGYVQYRYKKDLVKAGEAFERAAQSPDAPPAAKILAGINFARAGQRETAIAIWRVAAESSENEYTRERAKEYLEHYAIIEFYEQQGKVFKTRYGRFPNTLEELKTGGLIRDFPPDPVNIELKIDPKTGAVSEVEK